MITLDHEPDGDDGFQNPMSNLEVLSSVSSNRKYPNLINRGTANSNKQKWGLPYLYKVQMQLGYNEDLYYTSFQIGMSCSSISITLE